MVKLKCSTYFPFISLKFSSNFLQLFQMTKLNCFHHHRSTDVCKNTGIGKTFYSKECFLCKNSQPVARLLRQPLLYLLRQHLIWHLVCVCVCVCVRVSGWISQPYIVLCPVSKHKLAEMPQQDTCAFEQHRSIPAKTRGETVKRSYLLVLHQGLKQLHSKCAANWNRKKWKAWSKKVALQDPASMAENRHRDYLHRCHAGFRSFLSASSNCHPAKRRALTTQRARKTQYDFGGKFHPHLQRLGNTKGLASWR